MKGPFTQCLAQGAYPAWKPEWCEKATATAWQTGGFVASGRRTATRGTTEPSHPAAPRWPWAPGQTKFLCSRLDLPTNLP